MNLDQILSLVRTLLAAGGPVSGLLVMYGHSQTKADLWLAVALIVIPPVVSGVWGIVTKTDKAKVAAAGAMQGVEVTVAPNASAGAKSAAQDPDVPGVKPTLKESTT
jgi:hypothetical protein